MRKIKYSYYLFFAAIIFTVSISSASNRMISSSTEDDATHVLWFIKSDITSHQFPIGFITSKSESNISIATTWGYTFESTIIRRDNLVLVWVEVDASIPNSVENITIIVDKIDHYEYSITWDLAKSTNLHPTMITVDYSASGHWMGAYFKRTIFTSNGSIDIDYTIERTNFANLLPYPNNISLNLNNASIWSDLSNTLTTNSAFFWTSWFFPPGNPDDLPFTTTAVDDGVNWVQTVYIQWNDTSVTSYKEMFDPYGERIYAPPEASQFNLILMKYIDDLVKKYSNTTAPNPMEFPVFFTIILPSAVLIIVRRKISPFLKK